MRRQILLATRHTRTRLVIRPRATPPAQPETGIALLPTLAPREKGMEDGIFAFIIFAGLGYWFLPEKDPVYGRWG